MRKTVLPFLALAMCCVHTAFGFCFPELKKEGLLSEFVPSGWNLKDTASGDLNEDGLRDMVFVIEYQDTVTEQRPDSSHNTAKPRVLLVLLRKNADTYSLFLLHNTFLLREGEGGMTSDPYQRPQIKNHTLFIGSDFTRSSLEYQFRILRNELCLVYAATGGASGGEIASWTFDFIGHLAIHSTGPVSGSPGEKKITLKTSTFLLLKDMPMPQMREILPGAFL